MRRGKFGGGVEAGSSSSTGGEQVQISRELLRTVMTDAMTHDPGEEHPGKRRRQQAMQMNIGDWSTKDYNGHFVEQVEVDGSVDWNAIGGMRPQIDTLKECVLHPLLYPDMYDALGVVPPRGVLLYGPPGCGKTLAARALAGACRGAGVHVSFFARKGGDIQSKFVGEAEQRLTALFEAAKRSAPSIIFFDEIDGLAPARSESGSEGTSHHNSVVATLLALMDGLVARGRVAILAATNRPELLDAALRRPGRFDRELRFAPPAADERLQILEVLTQQWPRISREAGGGASKDCLRRLAFERTAGLTGAELRALTAEAAIRSIRRTFPQLYGASGGRFHLSPERIQVTEEDFDAALATLAAPGARASRSAAACGLASVGGEVPISPLSQEISPLLLEPLQRLQRLLEQMFPPWGGACGSSGARSATAGGSARVPARPARPSALLGVSALVRAADAHLLGLLEPALLWGFELPAFMISLDAVVASPDGAAAHLRRVVAAAAAAAPSALLVPRLDRWRARGAQSGLDVLGRSPSTLLLRALQQIPLEAPVLVLGTALAPRSSMEVARPDLKRKHSLAFGIMAIRRRLRLGSSPESPGQRGRAQQRQTSWARLQARFEKLDATLPGRPEAHAFLTGLLRRGVRALVDNLLEEQHLRGPLPELPAAPTEGEDVQEGRRVAEMSREQLEEEEKDDRYWLRLFRNQVRQILQALAKYTRFAVFNQSPGDIQEAVPIESLGQVCGPVTLSELVARNDAHEYHCVEDVRADFRRIQENIRALFSDKSCSSQRRVREYASELLDKAEAKLDCIDREIVSGLSRAQGRRRLRKAELQRRAEGGNGKGAELAVPGREPALRPSSRHEQRPTELPPLLEESLREAAGRLLADVGMRSTLELSEVLKAGRRIQRNLSLALSPDAQQGIGRTGGAHARTLMKKLTDSFAGEYLQPESLDSFTASTLLARRHIAFQRWCQTRGGHSHSAVRHTVNDAMAALLGEEKPRVRLQPLR